MRVRTAGWPRSLAVALLALALPSAAAHAERLPIKTYTTADGLPNNEINRIVTDASGFIWFCTREGLARFDGYGFTSYGIEDGLPTGPINDLLQANDGHYWIATDRGLVRFDPRAEPARRFRTLLPGEGASAQVTTLLQGRGGNVWLGTLGGLFAIRPGGLAVVPVVLRDGVQPEILHLEADTSGALWIGTSTGLFHRSTDGRVEHYTMRDGLPGDFVPTVLAYEGRQVWVASADGRIATMESATGGRRAAVGRLYPVRSPVGVGAIREFLKRSNGTWSLVSTGGIAALDPVAGAFRIGPASTFEALGAGEVLSAAEDRRGSLWIGGKSGATRVFPGAFTVFGAADGLPAAATLVETPSGDVVVTDASTWRWRAGRVDGERLVFAQLPLSRARASWGWNQMLLVDHLGDWWIGTRNGVLRYRGLQALEGLSGAVPIATYTRADGLAADVIIRLFEDSRGDVWIATVGEGRPNGLSRWRRASATFEHVGQRDGLPSLDQFYVSSFAEDRSGAVWIGLSGDAGLARCDRRGAISTFAAPDGIAHGSIRNLLVDSRGRLWAATHAGGLLVADDPTAARPSFSTYTRARGLSSNRVTAIVEDANGFIYAGTARGIDRLDPETGRIKTLSGEDGLPIGEILAALRDRSGVLWFSYTVGLVRLVPQRAAPVAPPPQMRIMAIYVADKPRPVSAVGETSLPALTLPSRRSLRVEFVAPGAAAIDALRYQFRLREQDAWSAPSEERVVTYGSLAPGRYRFAVRAVDFEGRASDVAGFGLIVLAPVWQRWWFLSSTAAMLTGAAFAWHRRRMARLLRVADMRTRIATDLHDDIGANLTRIAVLSEVARRQLPDAAAPADAHLASIAAVARDSVTSMRDIVWEISPGHDSVADLVERMRDYAAEVLPDVEVTFDGTGQASRISIAATARRELYLFFKEAVNNIARHAAAAHAHVTFRCDVARLRLEIADDGRGFDLAIDREGNGMGNMRKRADRLNGTLQVVSRPGHGTRVGLEVPARRLRLPA